MCGRGGVTGPTCNEARTAVTSIILPGANLSGTLPAAIAAWADLAAFMVNDNYLSGSIPAAVAGSWPRLKSFRVDGNHLTGRVPPLGFGPAAGEVSDCLLYYHKRWGTNDFDCPWPEGATSVCRKWDDNSSQFDEFVTDADCRG